MAASSGDGASAGLSPRTPSSYCSRLRCTLLAKSAALEGRDPEHPGERVAGGIEVARAGEHLHQRRLRGILRVRRTRERPPREPEQHGPQDIVERPERAAVSIREANHEPTHFEASGPFHDLRSRRKQGSPGGSPVYRACAQGHPGPHGHPEPHGQAPACTRDGTNSAPRSARDAAIFFMTLPSSFRRGTSRHHGYAREGRSVTGCPSKSTRSTRSCETARPTRAAPAGRGRPDSRRACPCPGGSPGSRGSLRPWPPGAPGTLPACPVCLFRLALTHDGHM